MCFQPLSTDNTPHVFSVFNRYPRITLLCFNRYPRITSVTHTHTSRCCPILFLSHTYIYLLCHVSSDTQRHLHVVPFVFCTYTHIYLLPQVSSVIHTLLPVLPFIFCHTHPPVVSSVIHAYLLHSSSTTFLRSLKWS